jgi:hypothetical protein
MGDTPIFPFRRIFHHTDFSAADSAAFAHAVKLTCLVQGELTMMHVDPTVGRQALRNFPASGHSLHAGESCRKAARRKMSRAWASKSNASAPSQTIRLVSSSNT